MTVYVDDVRLKFGRMIMCHMTADTAHELHAMAERIGMKRTWYQLGSLPHYDVSLSRKVLAIEHGAVLIPRADLLDHIRKIRQIVLRDPAPWRA